MQDGIGIVNVTRAAQPHPTAPESQLPAKIYIELLEHSLQGGEFLRLNNITVASCTAQVNLVTS